MNIKQYHTVKPFPQPTGILEQLECDGWKSEMTDSELAFLCGLIRDHQPKKIVEVGVAAGGTTAVILSCVHELHLGCEIYSVDISEQYHRDLKKDDKSVMRKTGFLIKEISGYGNELSKHTLLTGKLLPERLDEIGDDIDFLILDTTHCMPGELLDFIAAFPYLAENAVVVLHDIILWHKQDRRRGRSSSPFFCTGILFQTVTADKFLNHQEIYPNIGAFRINKDTVKYITDLFVALMITWSYMLKSEQLAEYEKLIEKKYSAECLQLYQQAVLAADSWFNWNKEDEKIMEMVKGMMRGICQDSIQNILLYGAGKRGTKFIDLAKSWGVKINGFIVSDSHHKTESVKGLPVYSYSQIPFHVDETLIIQTANSLEVEYRLRQSKFHWISLPDVFWNILE